MPAEPVLVVENINSYYGSSHILFNLSLVVKQGEAVTQGQKVLVLEAMKMENAINAPKSGTVDSIQVHEGVSVNAGDALLTIG